VDVVAGDGLEWFKVSLLSNNRLLFDKAKLGWEDASSSEEEEDDDEEAEKKEEFGSKKEEDDNDVPLVKMTKDLVRAAKEVKIRTRSPRITLVLPKLREGEVPEIDCIMDQLRSLGANLL
jgi:DNA/RNA-binding domain of Phe-tRNA-synthetase-like protein